MSKLFIVSLLFSLPAWALLNATALASQNEPNYQKALRFLEYRQAQSACKTLTPALSLDNDVCDGNASANFKQKIKSINKQYNDSLSLLGITLRQLGYYDLAGEALEAAQANARTSEEQENISLSLANVNQSNYYRLLAQYRNADEINKKDEALDPLIIAAKNSLSQYEELWNSADNSVKIKSKLNWLILLSSFTSDIPELAELKKQSKFNQVVQDINTDINGLTEQDQIESRLKYAEALRQLAVSDSNFLNASLAQAENALDLSIKAKDSIHSSQAFGLLGKIYLQNLDSQKAEANFAKAQSFALANHSLELAYQWQWELGKIYANRGDARALPQYKAAVDSLNLLRKNLITLNPDSQFGFQEQIEPLYKEYLALLFNQKQPDLKEIIQVNEVVQVTELENYLQCSQLQVSSILNLKAKDSPDAVIYMIRLPHSYELIVRQKNGNLIHRTAKFSVIDTALNNVQQNLSSEKIDNLDSGGFQSLFGELYQASFKLIEDVLPKNGTIVISGDSQLLSIPWGILYDGNHYLIERYSIAYSLGVDTQAPRLLKPGNLNVFAAGISDLSSKPNYSDLEYVPEELQGIKEVVSRTKTYLNQQFTTDNLLKKSTDFSVVHLATHGQFSSNPNESFLLDWDSKISLKEIRSLVQSPQTPNPKGLELLVLSACESAKGDKRAALGLAGTAIQAGARSTVASQWVINDRSQADLMKRFYQELMQGKTKAEALRLAQLSILNSKVFADKFANPYYWG